MSFEIRRSLINAQFFFLYILKKKQNNLDALCINCERKIRTSFETR
jgi:hypothetical protein